MYPPCLTRVKALVINHPQILKTLVLIRESLLSSVDGSTSEDSLYLLDKCVDLVGSEPTVSSMGTRNLGSSDM